MREMKMAREAYGECLVELGETNKDIVVLDADLSASTQTGKFARAYPERFFNCGVAEQNMTGIAGGMAACGKIPFISTFSIFASGRAWEQVRNTIAVCNLNVKIVATHGGISVGPDGVSHQSLEDVALMRSIPGMTVIVPCDAPETKAAVRAAAEYKGPVFIRLGRPKVPTIWSGDKYTIGKAQKVQEGSDVTIVACGIMVDEAIQASEILKSEGISVDLINMGTIKPLDTEMLLDSVNKTGCVVTCEEHSVIGGLTGAVSEFLMQNRPVPLKAVAVHDRFGQSGDPADLMVEYELSKDNIVNAAKSVIKRK